MKKQIEKLISEANTLVNDHLDATCGGMCEELVTLKSRFVALLNTFDTVDPDSEEWASLDSLLDEANEALQRAEDATEAHYGGRHTQL